MTNLENTKALTEDATDGPWEVETIPETGESRVLRRFEFFGEQIEIVAPGGMQREDAAFIVHARTALPALVAAVERVQALHEPLKLFLLDDNGSIDYSKPFDTLCRGCTDPDIVNAWECDDGDPGDDYVQHPCPTIEALEAP